MSAYVFKNNSKLSITFSPVASRTGGTSIFICPFGRRLRFCGAAPSSSASGPLRPATPSSSIGSVPSSSPSAIGFAARVLVDFVPVRERVAEASCKGLLDDGGSESEPSISITAVVRGIFGGSGKDQEIWQVYAQTRKYKQTDRVACFDLSNHHCESRTRQQNMKVMLVPVKGYVKFYCGRVDLILKHYKR